MTEAQQKEFLLDIDSLNAIYEKHNPIKKDGTFDFSAVRACIIELTDAGIKDEGEKEAFKDWMLEKTDFMKSPASTRFHGNFEHGLSVHSLAVVRQALLFARPIMQNFWQTPIADTFCISAEDVFVSSMAHDFCKADTYRIEFHNVKDVVGNWKKVPSYKTRSDSRNLGHGNESVLRLLEIMPSLIRKRYVLEAISRHMGFSDLSETESYNYSVFLGNPLVVLVQLADQTAAHWYSL